MATAAPRASIGWCLECLAYAATDPLRALVIENWLASCGGLFRSDRVSIDYFDGVTRHYEWTFLAYSLRRPVG